MERKMKRKHCAGTKMNVSNGRIYGKKKVNLFLLAKISKYKMRLASIFFKLEDL